MSAKTGYVPKDLGDDVKHSYLMKTVTGAGRHAPELRRVCIRVDEVPEQMPRRELREKIRRGWEVRLNDQPSIATCLRLVPDGGWWLADDSGGRAWLNSLARVTHARPHDECCWIRIEGD